MKKTIVTRSANDKLYKIAKSFWSNENTFIQCKQFAGFSGALEYLLHLFEGNTYNGFIVNCDEDFFLTNESLVDAIIEQMKIDGYAYCGVPDGGVISHRNKSVFNVNPFFNVFNVDLIKTKFASFNNSKQFEYGNQVEKNANLDEPFAGFFYWLHLNFKHANFTNIESTDGISTIIKINDKPMGIHSWYSRHYGIDEAQTLRIDNCIEWALLNKQCK